MAHLWLPAKFISFVAILYFWVVVMGASYAVVFRFILNMHLFVFWWV